MLHVGDRVTYNEAGAIVRYVYMDPMAEIKLDNGTTIVTRASNLVPETPPCKVASRGCPCRRGRRRRLASRWFGRLC
jgi:hypothetical protein